MILLYDYFRNNSIVFSFPVKRKTCFSWYKEENAAIKKSFACHLAQQEQPMHHDVLLALKHFPILQERGVLKIKNKVRNDITLKCNHVS